MQHVKLPVKLWAVIPAAGAGKRFSQTQLKQYLKIAGSTVLEHSVAALYQLPLAGCVIAIAAEDEVAQSLTFQYPVSFCLGGQERMDSVLAGLESLKQYAHPDDYVLVHDAARPCLHHEQMKKITDFCQTGQDAAIIAVPVRDTLKKADHSSMIEATVSREQLWQAQTPQIVKFSILYQALQYVVENKLLVTDEASALEYLKVPVQLIQGRSDNIKITYPEDLALAKLILHS